MNFERTVVMANGGGGGWARPVMCAAHPQATSTGVCPRCRKAMCFACTSYDGALQLGCTTCVRNHGILRGLVKGLVGLTAIAALGAGIHKGSQKLDAMAIAEEHTKAVAAVAKKAEEKDAALQLLADALAKEPCDRTKASQYANDLIVHGEPRRAIAAADAFFPRCGEHARLRGLAYSAHMQLSEWDAAADQASKLIATDPNDATAFGWRGRAYEEKGDLERAATDFKQTLALRDDYIDIPLNLANALDRLDRPCEGIAPLEGLVAHAGRMGGVDAVKARIDRLYANPRCAELRSEGRATIRIPKDEGMIFTNVTFDGSVKSRVLVDTGASTVVISRKLAVRLGMNVDALPTVKAGTAGGVRLVHLGLLDSVALQGVKVHKVPVAISDDMDGMEPLLGQSFLSRFTITIDRKAGKMELVGRKSG